MSELIVIGYDNPVQARSAYDEVMAMQGDFVVELRGLAIVTVDAEGKSHVESPAEDRRNERRLRRPVGDAARPAVLRAVLRRRTGRPDGCAVRQAGKSGINDEFRQQVQELHQPGKATIVIMAEKITEDKFAERMAPYGGTLLKTSLSEADERELGHDLNPTANPAHS